MQTNQHLVIIGNGITGITCACEVRKKSKCKITVISEESPYFFSRPALMYVFMGHMKWEHTYPYENWFWHKNKIDLRQEKVLEIKPLEKKIILRNKESISYDKLVLATGSIINKFDWPGQDSRGVQGFYSKQDLELLEENCKSARSAVIVGGGLIGIEVAEMLLSRRMKVHFLVREKFFWNNVLPDDEASLISNLILKHHVDLRLNTQLKEIVSDSNERVTSILTDRGETMECQLVVLCAGVSPNTELARSSGINTQRGILINSDFETNFPDIFAAGDCAEFLSPPAGRKSVEQVWYTGKLQAETLARILCKDKTSYQPGIWFNSAKFFDLEYQVYGEVPNKSLPGCSSFYWQSPSMQHCIRFHYEIQSKAILGVHALGIRLRQNVIHDWITQKRTLAFVIENLNQANFDPEFFKKHEKAISFTYSKGSIL